MFENFTPFSAAVGGGLIGAASLMLLVFNGRVMGVSGIAAGLVGGQSADAFWRIAFLVGLMIAPVVYMGATTQSIPFAITSNTGLLIVSGLLVGFGTRMGNGCTSGHGICGISRFSIRSIVATCIFMLVAIGVKLLANLFGVGG